MPAPEPHEHFGVYGAWLQDGRLVTIEKVRGPYTGWLDLPGGAPEAGECREQTLARELDEECGAAVRSVLEWHPFEFRVELASDRRRPIDFRHRGLIALVDALGPVRPVESVEDVARVVLLDLGSDRPVSPPVSLAQELLARRLE
ncbi:hypothetical protein GCM10027515_27480 [Schumannella luteola]|uniref:8-oxo-dGTP pyrophosphatase MutT (NUDIX family) n=1 Tax=Schumannella luteola TaxID=472059 RepID=A0A852YDS9_9MICO|nr:NUDIX domain-containing protein [Schumannella luteola]NYG99454.1 8-oxo-dGTP pyrophosphatase MutT (NUDIX family) [Schumannella luteola]TPX06168.1 NUDIX domain-containing protein [Schumannella luteola]